MGIENNYKYMDELFLEETKLLDKLDVVREKSLDAISVKNGVILPCKTIDGSKKAGVIDEKGEYVELSSFEALSPVDCWGGKYETSSVNKVDKRVLYLGRFWKHWGHFLMDLVSRLWYVQDKESDITIAYDSEVEISGVYLEFLRLLGISKKQLFRVNVPTKFNEVIVPECSHKPGIMCSTQYKKLFDGAARNALAEFEEQDKYKDQKIYFTRTGLKTRIPLEVGEKQIEKIFEKNGYMIISPEKYSLVEQIAMLRLASEICCVSGTLPHNMIFANDGAKLTIIRKSNKPVYRQWDVNKIRNLDVTTVDAHISLHPVGAAGPFILDLNDNLKNYFKDNNIEFKYNAFAQFFRRKAKLLWYLPVNYARNHGKNPRVPLFNGTEFVNRDGAEEELKLFYKKRI